LPYPVPGVMSMAPSVDQGAALAALVKAHPDRHIWHSPNGRWFAARKVPLSAETGPMTVSAETLKQLAARLSEQPELIGRCL
jgi:hypothetical protein